MKNAIKSNTKEIKENIQRIDALIEEVPDEDLPPEQRNKFIRQLLKLIEAQIAQIKIYAKE